MCFIQIRFNWILDRYPKYSQSVHLKNMRTNKVTHRLYTMHRHFNPIINTHGTQLLCKNNVNLIETPIWTNIAQRRLQDETFMYVFN